MDTFLKGIKEELNNELQETENGALGFATTGKSLLDMNFKLSSYRSATDETIEDDFARAFAENPRMAVKFLFFVGDIRGGAGERRTFRVCLKWLANFRPEWAKAVLPLIPEYNRWDSMLWLFDTPVESDMLMKLAAQLAQDLAAMAAGQPVSLLAKWLPSANTSSKETRRKAQRIIKSMIWNFSPKKYRKTLAQLRAYIRVTEVKMSANEWADIDYKAVPSQANLKYKDAFLRHDEERRRAYLDALAKGDTEIKAKVLAPHEIVQAYTSVGRVTWRATPKASTDETLEALWKALPDYVKGEGRSIAVVDGSSSMGDTIGHTKIQAHAVARGLGLYFAERLSGPFKDKYITFSGRPRLVDFSNLKTLRERLELAVRYDECENTNIEAVFDLIVDTAYKNKLPQSELPANVVVISDMEFDEGTTQRPMGKRAALFKLLKEKYDAAGYKFPRLVFWNVNSRTCTVPLQENELGVSLVSGFTPAIVKMVLSGKLDPFVVLKEMLDSERYAAVDKALDKVDK